MITAYKYLPREKIPDPEELFNPSVNGVRRSKGWTLKPGKSKLEIRHK